MPRPSDSTLAAWRGLIGAEHVLTGGDALEAAGRCTFADAPLPSAVLLPGTADETAACLRVAHAARTRVHPVSTGRNWGYGSGCPPHAGTTVLRLARLDRVLDFDDDRGLVTIQPGVTFGGLDSFLRAQGGRWWPPSVGAGPDVSVVGNVLQRGLGQGPYRELARHVYAAEALCSDGTCLRTGPAPGPDPTGLLFQGGPVVVTAVTLWLRPAPALRQRITFRIPRADCLPLVVDGARAMLRGGAADGQAADVLSAARVAAGLPPGASVPDVMTGAWTGGTEVWAPDDDALRSLRGRALAWAAAHGDVWEVSPPLPGAPTSGDAPAGPVCAYRSKPGGPGSDPDRDGCGVLWFVPLLPMRGAQTARVVALIERIGAEEGVAPSVSLRLGPRDLYCVTGLFWDRDEPGADARGARCHALMSAECARLGVFTYRPVLGRWPPEAVDPGAQRLLAQVRSALDPRGVLASHLL
ncbi:FAD-binding oxidoreductase [Kitasatospora griseola]|uniref:FAD-binding oxidoreductase n=1 Tax=Kitasatospora griseola TaxID=2064 RepID=UPI00382FE21D